MLVANLANYDSDLGNFRRIRQMPTQFRLMRGLNLTRNNICVLPTPTETLSRQRPEAQESESGLAAVEPGPNLAATRRNSPSPGKLRPKSVELDPDSPRFGPSSPISTTSPRFRPNHRSGLRALTGSGPKWGSFGPDAESFGSRPSSADVGPNSTNRGPNSPDSSPISRGTGQIWPRSGQCCAEIDQFGSG